MGSVVSKGKRIHSTIKMAGPSTLILLSAMLAMSMAADKPHVVFFLMDDMGYNDCSWHNDKIEMPHLDELAKEGLILDSNYVGPVCSPTRSSLMTGKYMYKIKQNHGVYNPDTPECLPLKEQLLGGKLKEMGYATHIVGKWHLGYCDEACLPKSRGFDTQYGFYGSHINHYNYIWGAPGIWEGQDWYDNQVFVNETGNGHENFAPQLMDVRAEKLIAEHDPETPFFLYFASGMTHFPIQTPPGYEHSDDTRETFEQMANFGDHQVGVLVNALKAAGMWEDTIFAFSSDNGGQDGCGSNYPLRGWKSSLWEGGVRVPGMFHYPKAMDESVKGTKTEGIMYIADWFNTIVSMVGGEVNPELDSIDQSEFLLHGAPSARNSFIYNLDNHFGQPYGQAAIRVGDYKLLVGYAGDTDGGEGEHALWGHEHGTTFQMDYWGVAGEEDHTDGVSVDLVPEWRLADDAGSAGRKKKGIRIPAAQMPVRNAYAKTIANRAILFNLKDDPSETTDLAGDLPEVVAEMLATLKKAYDSMPESLDLVPDQASRNPAYGGVWTTGWCPQIHNEH